MLLFFQRFLISITQYSYLSQASLVFGAIQTIILFWGIRFLFLFTPFFTKKLKSYSFIFSIVCAIVGNILLWYFSPTIGIIVFVAGLSMANFLLKKASSRLPKKAGWNKIAINLGNLAVGIGLHYFCLEKTIFLQVMSIPLIIVLAISIFDRSTDNSDIERQNYLPFTKISFFWLVIGTIVGIRIFGAYTVMSKYLSLHDALSQYGFLLSLYSILVIIVQLPSIFKKHFFSLRISVLALIISVIVMGIPQFFAIHRFYGSVIWIAILAAEEIFSPYIDYYSNLAGCLIYKELGISLGGAIIPILFEDFNNYSEKILYSLILLIFLAIGVKKMFKNN